jgi:hypothetical protein
MIQSLDRRNTRGNGQPNVCLPEGLDMPGRFSSGRFSLVHGRILRSE